MSVQPPVGPVVGFDLDMTLVDSRAGIAATLQAALAEVGVEIVPEQVWPYIGVSLELTVAALAPDVDPVTVVHRYRELYPRTGVPSITLLPGAVEALRAVHAHGGQVFVVSTKVEPAVRAVLRHVGLDHGPHGTHGTDDPRGPRGPHGTDGVDRVDRVAGGLFGADKGTWLAAAGAQVYVGDHPGDVEAARVAGAVSVAVATGPHPAGELAACGADVVLADLTAFAPWLATFEQGRNRQEVGGTAGS